ncbi:oligopeptide/dipeptide ABC transporter ATP-binding protein [Bradyrhizobium guangxiense]
MSAIGSPVMYLGRIVEVASRNQLYKAPLHPYTQGLLAAAPIPNPSAEALRPQQVILGESPSVMNPPSGCRFHPRCPMAMKVCAEVDPPLRRWRMAALPHAACTTPRFLVQAEIVCSLWRPAIVALSRMSPLSPEPA